jgi:hypothetical protein
VTRLLAGRISIRVSMAGMDETRDFASLQSVHVGWDSSVGIATRYGLDGPGLESWWGRDSPHLVPTLYNGYRVFLGGKAAGAWR